jgi:hypothetical protein
MASQPPTALTTFDPKGGIPAHLQQFFSTEGANIVPRQTVNSLMITGKVWTLSVDGAKTPLQRRNQDGDLEPLATMKGIVLDYAKERGRAYYAGAYDPNNTSQPTCWSADGVVPDASLPGPFAPGTVIEAGKSYKVHSTCANCPMSVKGSRTTPDGKATVACSEHRMVAFLPDPAMGLPANLMKPLRLKLAMTSMWDAQSPEQEQQGWLSFDKYVDWLASRGCTNTAGVVTKMKFDTNAAYPKIFFASERPVTAEELSDIVVPLIHDDATKKLLGGTWTPAGADGVSPAEQDVAEPQGAVSVAPAAVAAPVGVAAQPAPNGYRMADGETYTLEQFRASGWTDEQLIANGKLIAVAAPAPQPEVVAAPAAPPPAAAPVQETPIVVGEAPAATATVAATSTPSPTSVPASAPEAVVIAETVTSAPQQPAAPAVVQENAQATAPPPQATAPAPEPPAAAAAAAAATPAVSTDVPEGLASIMAEWDPETAPAAPAA